MRLREIERRRKEVERLKLAEEIRKEEERVKELEGWGHLMVAGERDARLSGGTGSVVGFGWRRHLAREPKGPPTGMDASTGRQA